MIVTNQSSGTTGGTSPVVSSSWEEYKTTPIPVILARNIQKFFAGTLLDPATAGRGTAANPSSDLDVPTLLEDIDVILDGRSVAEGTILLRGMVADLLREIDLLRFRCDETTKSLQRVKEERDIVNHDYRDRLAALTLALSSATSSCSGAASAAYNNNNNNVNADDNDDDGPARATNELQQKCRSGVIVTPNEATMLTIQCLTSKIESLNIQVGKQQEQLLLRRERIDDLECDNAAKVHKIAALERQLRQGLPVASSQHPTTTTKSKINSNTTSMSQEQRDLPPSSSSRFSVTTNNSNNNNNNNKEETPVHSPVVNKSNNKMSAVSAPHQSPTSVAAAEPSSPTAASSPSVLKSTTTKNKIVWQPPTTSFVPPTKQSPPIQEKNGGGRGSVATTKFPTYNTPSPTSNNATTARTNSTAKKYAKPKLVKLVDLSS